jgi:hypothetical protein
MKPRYVFISRCAHNEWLLLLMISSFKSNPKNYDNKLTSILSQLPIANGHAKSIVVRAG